MTEQNPTVDQVLGTPAETPFTAEDRAALEARVADAEKAAADATRAAAKAAGDDKDTRYAAYDETYLKYVPGTFASARDARAAAKDAGVTSVRIDEV